MSRPKMGTALAWKRGADTTMATHYRSTNVSIADNSNAYIAMTTLSDGGDSARYTTSTVSWFSAVGTVFVVNFPGIYVVWGHARFAPNSTGIRSITIGGSRLASSLNYFYQGPTFAIDNTCHDYWGGMEMPPNLCVIPVEAAPFFFNLNAGQTSGAALTLYEASINVVSVLDY